MEPRRALRVVYSVLQPPFAALWRVDADGGSPPVRVEQAGFNATFPRVAPSADRLIFTRSIQDTDIYRFRPGQAAEPVAQSSVFDGNARYSADGRWIAFCSTRSADAMEIWIAAADGSAPRQLTRGPGKWQCSPSWSPDGRTVAFESLGADGRWSVWRIGIEDGEMREVTTHEGDHNAPTWSRDGQWLYFSSDRGNGRDIWRVRTSGSRPERVTQDGSGVIATETLDGRVLLYQPRTVSQPHDPINAPLMAQPLDGGAPRQIVACVLGTAFAAGPRGVYYVPCQRAIAPDVYLLNTATGDRQRLGALERYQNNMPSGFVVSPDGDAILYNRFVSDSEDLVVVENFR
jgi:Tol biopolymer transport system component